MKLLAEKSIRYLYITLLMCAFLLSGCSSAPLQIARVDQNVKEGRLLPSDALDITDVLNQYTHDYPVPKSKDMDLDIDVDKQKLFTQGDEVFMQLAMVTRPAAPQPVHVHVLVYDETSDKAEHAGFEKKILDSLNKGSQEFHRGGTLTVNFSANTQAANLNYPALQSNHAKTLKAFIAAYSLIPGKESGHLYLLLLGDVASLSTADKQDIVDMAKVIAASGNELSVLSYGEKPDFAFLTDLVRSGQGLLTFKNDFFHANEWVNNELKHVHAYTFRDVQISLRTLHGVHIEEIVSPKNITHTQDSVDMKIPQILSGDQYVLLVKLAASGIRDKNYRDLVDVKIQYYEPKQDKYGSIERSYRLDYSMDRNDTKSNRKGRIARSKLIIATYDTLSGIPAAVSANRNYKAVADLVSQTTALEHFVQDHKDQELERDIRILKKYSLQLREFDQSWFKGWKKWKDMYFDSDRFTQKYD